MEKAWAHQAESILKHGLDAAHALFWEPRVGKTNATIGHINRLILERDVTRILVIGPKMPLDLTWYPALKERADWETFNLTSSSIARRSEVVKVLCPTRKKPMLAAPTILLVNYDVIQAMRLILMRFKPELVVLDEAHAIKHHRKLRTLSAQRLGDAAPYRRILTGTPDPQSYADYYSLYRFLDRDVFGSTIAAFRARYCKMHPFFSTTVVGYNEEHYEELQAKVHSLASRKTREECFELPERQVVVRYIDMPKASRDLYNRIKKEKVVEDGPMFIDASYKITQLGIMQRLTSGHVKIGNEIFWKHKAKIEAALAEAREIVAFDKKLVVFFVWRAEGEQLRNAFEAEFGEDRVALLHGDTPTEERERVTAPFDPSRDNGSSRLRVLIVQERVGSLGVSFAQADHAIFTSYSMNYGDHSQAADRIWKPGGKITLTYLVVPRSVDITARAVVSHKEARSKLLLDTPFEQLADGEV